MKRLFHAKFIASISPLRKLNLFLTMVIATGLLLASLPYSVLAGQENVPPASSYSINLIAKKQGDDRGIVCVGDTLEFHVEVRRSETVGSSLGEENIMGGRKTISESLAGATIQAAAKKPDIFKLTSRIPTVTSASSSPPNIAVVKFKAEKEGYSDIHFRAAIPEKYFFEDSLKKISAEDLNRLKNQEVKTNYKAIYCPYEVLLKQRVTIKTPSNLLDSIGVVNWVELKGVNSDLALKGEGIKYMAVVYEDLICKFSWMTGSGDVEFQGLKVGPVGVYAISYGFGKAQTEYKVACPHGTGTIEEIAFAEPPTYTFDTVPGKAIAYVEIESYGPVRNFTKIFIRPRPPKDK